MVTIYVTGKVVVPVSGASEGDYSSWSKVLDTTIAGTGGYYTIAMAVDNNGNVLVFQGQSYAYGVNLVGTVFETPQAQLTFRGNVKLVDESSLTGRYQVIFDTSVPETKVFKNGVLLATIPTPSTSWFSPGSGNPIGCAISPNGQYIALQGNDVSNFIDRVQVWKGS